MSVQIVGVDAVIDFDRFDLDSYALLSRRVAGTCQALEGIRHFIRVEQQMAPLVPRLARRDVIGNLASFGQVVQRRTRDAETPDDLLRAHQFSLIHNPTVPASNCLSVRHSWYTAFRQLDSWTGVAGQVSKKIDLTGQRFGQLVVVREAGRTAGGRVRWECRCDCGKVTLVDRSNLTSGRQTGCGCAIIAAVKAANTRHGMSKTRTYRSWSLMRARCENPKTQQWPFYGGRGIRVCDRWQSFEHFYADMGDRPEGATLDRIDSDGDYEPDNCRWATPTEQARNRRNTATATYRGVTRPLTEWAELTGIDYHAIHGRIKDGWAVERALTTPVISR